MLRCVYTPRRWAHRRGGFVTGGTGWSKPPPRGLGPAPKKSEWWAVDGEMHEIGDGVPHRERFAIPRDNLPNRRRKQMREQFMRRTRLVLKDSEHEIWCKKYMELYQELRENWERVYWDEGYSKKIAEDHANYDSAEEDDLDFSPYSRRRRSNAEPNRDFGFVANNQGETWERVTQIRDKFEYDRERRIRERAFAPMNMENNFGRHEPKFRSHDNSSFASTRMEGEGSRASTYGNRSDRSSQYDSSFRDTPTFGNCSDRSSQYDLSFRNDRNSNFHNEPSSRNHHYPDFRSQQDTRNQSCDE